MIDKELFKLIKKKFKYIILSAIDNFINLFLNIGFIGLICLVLYNSYEGFFEKNNLLYVFILLIIILRFILQLLNGYFKNKITEYLKKDLRNELYRKLLTISIDSREEIGLAGLTQLASDGIEQLSLYYTSYLPTFFLAISAPIVLFGICISLDLLTGILLLVAVPIIPMSIIFMSKFAKKIFAKYWNKYITLGDSFLDSLHGFLELKSFDATSSRNLKMNEEAEEFRHITMKVLVMQLFSLTVMDLVAYGGAAIGITTSIYSKIGQVNPFGALFLILIAIEFFLPLRAFGSAFHVAMNGATAGRKILGILKEDDIKWGDKPFTSGDIVLKDLSFSYNSEKNVLQDLNISFPQNSIISIVGESGTGKSTLIKLILGEVIPSSGNISINGTSIRDISETSLYENISVVSEKTYIFNDSIRNNFILVNKNVTESEMIESLKKVKLNEIVSEKGGLDYVINEDSSNFSGGEKQRLALAFNLTKKKEIYIFDEATSNVDVLSEEIIMKNIYLLSKNSIVILITHRIYNATKSNLIYVLKNNKVEEFGTHSELLSKHGEYYSLHQKEQLFPKEEINL
ncbi:MAG: ATP-binding cassette domain-containing protein [Acholeplasmatales bacterium]|jgi:ATP-binding cassette subfamily C protein|nr:ATP-binding cassette domain-containing protein [Acholeplasmatales bacterium]